MQVQTVAAQVLYKGHTIITTARESASIEDSTSYNPTAVISWNRPDRLRRVMFCLISDKLYRSSDDARAAALEEAKAWVDRHALT